MVAMNEPQGRGGKRRRGEGEAAGTGAGDGLIGRLKDGVAGAVRRVTLEARAAGREVEQAAGNLKQSAADALRDRVRTGYEQQKGQMLARVARAGEVASQTANALRAVKADNVAEYLDGASRRVGQATQYLEDHNVTEMIQDANELARRNRAVAVGGMLAAGFVLSRFLKASASRSAEVPSGGSDAAGGEGEPRTAGRARRGALADASTAR
jgi:hypothetical protein